MLGTALAESGFVPDRLARWGIRRMLAERLRELGSDAGARSAAKQTFLEECRRSPIAPVPERANAQHYEVPPAFFERVLGRRMKYSCALFPPGGTDLDVAEERMLALTCERAGIRDGMRILDLGSGWGSFSLFVADRHPACRILAVSNSKLQAEWLLWQVGEHRLHNVEVVTADVNVFEPERRFDRVVSIEMFEHLRNHGALLERVARWLEPSGRLFVHHFCHREAAYPYEDAGGGSWMARHFFTGGMMPSDDWLLHFPDALVVERRWRVGGIHYARTCEAWLRRLDANAASLRAILAEAYGERDAARRLRRWRLFFLACAELFAFREGREWWVAHVLLRPRDRLVR
jgi:cyclopropane-fatty-acyl-phospholipid synthase